MPKGRVGRRLDELIQVEKTGCQGRNAARALPGIRKNELNNSGQFQIAVLKMYI